MTHRSWQQAVVSGLLCLAPLAMTVARRSSTLLLVATTLAVLTGHRKSIHIHWRAQRIDPALLIGIAIIVIWATISLLWSPLPIRGLKQLAFDCVLPIACGLVLIVLAQANSSRVSIILFALAVAAASALIAFQLYSGIRFESFFNPKESGHEAWRFNMVIVSIALYVPALLMLMRRVPILAMAAILMIIFAALLSQSATSKAMLLAGFFVFVAARLLPRKVSLALGSVTLFSILLIQPWQGRLVEKALVSSGQYETLFESAKERIVIWEATGELAVHALPWGTGMGSSDAIAQLPIAQIIPEAQKFGLHHTHTHNAFLNVWLELGLPGLVGMLLIAAGIIRTLWRLPDTILAPSITLCAQIITVNLISHGAWQAWWFTAIMLGILALKQYAPKNVAKP